MVLLYCIFIVFFLIAFTPLFKPQRKREKEIKEKEFDNQYISYYTLLAIVRDHLANIAYLTYKMSFTENKMTRKVSKGTLWNIFGEKASDIASFNYIKSNKLYDTIVFDDIEEFVYSNTKRLDKEEKDELILVLKDIFTEKENLELLDHLGPTLEMIDKHLKQNKDLLEKAVVKRRERIKQLN